VQIELVLSDPRDQELHVVLHDLDGYDLALEPSQDDPPSLLLREGKVRTVDESSLFFAQIVLSLNVMMRAVQRSPS